MPSRLAADRQGPSHRARPSGKENGGAAAARTPAVQPAGVTPSAMRSGCACGGGCPRCQGRKWSAGIPDAGRALPAPLAQEFGARLGADFDQVRIHQGPAAASAARAFRASAYTYGDHIVLGARAPALDTEPGRRLLAHELTHVAQGALGSRPSQAPAVSHRSDRAEHEADRAAGIVAAGGRFTPRESPTAWVSRAGDGEEEAAPQPAPAPGVWRDPEPPPPDKTPPKEPPKEVPKEKDPAPADPCKLVGPPPKCETPAGPGQHPAKVSDTMMDRWRGRYVRKDGDQGEGCMSSPYVAGRTESVCTIGYGHQIPTCPILSDVTNEAPTAEEQKDKKIGLHCGCAATESFDCEGQLQKDARSGANRVHETVPVDLDQAQFDALVDITLHTGSVPDDLLGAIKDFWCTDIGKDYVRALYLKSALTRPKSTKIEKGFVNRRAHRVWPSKCGKS